MATWEDMPYLEELELRGLGLGTYTPAAFLRVCEKLSIMVRHLKVRHLKVRHLQVRH